MTGECQPFLFSFLPNFILGLVPGSASSAGLGGGFHIKAVGAHYGPVVFLVGIAKLRRHGQLVVEVGKAGVGVKGPCV